MPEPLLLSESWLIWHSLRSHLSFALPSETDCYCMFEGACAKSQAKAVMWTTTKLGQVLFIIERAIRRLHERIGLMLP
jgi:hypothetical protein